jgi:hypothetical protein
MAKGGFINGLRTNGELLKGATDDRLTLPSGVTLRAK